jgi:hypothetical protein
MLQVTLHNRTKITSVYPVVIKEHFNDYINMVKGKKTGYHTRHLFRAQPAKGTKSVKVVVKNRFGEVFTKEVKL